MVAERIVITGAGGQVGRYLAARGRARGRDVLALTSAQWDITDPAAAERIIDAGRRGGQLRGLHRRWTRAETDADGAYAVNAAGPGERRAGLRRAPVRG